MTAITPLEFIHKKGIFGNHHDKNENDLLNILELKNYNKRWITKTKNARSKLSNQYSVKKEITSIKFLEKKIRKLFN